LTNEEEKRQEQYELQRQVNELQETISKLELELAPYQFQYSDPSPDFDRSQVKGLVAELIELPSKNVKYTTALEVTAGGKLYNVSISSIDR
jgi:structural maintenance of chromosome 2